MLLPEWNQDAKCSFCGKDLNMYMLPDYSSVSATPRDYNDISFRIETRICKGQPPLLAGALFTKRGWYIICDTCMIEKGLLKEPTETK